jgi:hypothetical protein
MPVFSRLSSIANRASASRWLFLALLTAAVAAVYGSSFTYPSFNPEHAMFYELNANLGWSGVLKQYLGASLGFYRPTEFYGYYHMVSAVFGWHGIYGFKAVSLLLLVGYACILYRLGMVLWADDRLAAGLAAGIAAIHPLSYVFIYETVGFDLIYQILIMGCVLLYFSPALEGRQRWLIVAAVVLMFVVALTAKEQALALPALLAFYSLVFRSPPRPVRRARLAMTVAAVGIGIGFILFYWGRWGSVNSGAYRTGFNGPQVWVNLESGVLWLFHIFTVYNPAWVYIYIQNTISNFLFGLFLVFILGRYLFSALIQGENTGEPRRLLLVAAFLGAFMAIPVYSGGRPWHYGLPLAAFALIEGRAIASLARRFKSRQLQAGLVGAVAVAAVLLSAINFNRETLSQMTLFRINVEAMRHPPVPPAAMPHNSVVLYSVAERDVWGFGVGSLFRFAYLDPTLEEMTVNGITSLTDQEKQRWLNAPTAFFFAYDPEDLPAWRDCTLALRQRLSAVEVTNPSCKKEFPDTGPLRITAFGPTDVYAGQVFNKQPNGSAAIWIILNRATKSMSIYWDQTRI